MERLGELIVVLIIIVIAIKISRSRKIASKSAPTNAPIGSIVGDSWKFDFDIVGESFYQDNLMRIAGGKSETNRRIITTATIIPYDTNPHDPQAVRVEIEGLTVGHLTRDSAREYRRQLKQKGVENGIFTCSAVILGGWDRGNGDEGHFGVKLDIPTQ